MKIFDNGSDLRMLRKLSGLSQSKLAEITGIVQSRIPAYELDKNRLNQEELIAIQATIDKLDENSVQKLKIKR